MHKRGSSNLLWVQVSPSCFRHGGMVKVSFLLSLRWSRSSLPVRNPTGCTTAGAWASRPTRLARHVASPWRSTVLCRQSGTSRNGNWESVDASVGYPLDSEMAFVKIIKLVTKMLLFYAFLLLKRCKNVEHRQAQPAGLGYGLRTWDCSGYRGYRPSPLSHVNSAAQDQHRGSRLRNGHCWKRTRRNTTTGWKFYGGP